MNQWVAVGWDTADQVLETVQDIEELAELGNRLVDSLEWVCLE